MLIYRPSDYYVLGQWNSQNQEKLANNETRNIMRVLPETALLDGEKRADNLQLTLQIMTMKNMFNNVYNTWL